MTLSQWLAVQGRGSKADLARRIGISWQAIHAIACGRSVPRVRTALAIEAVTGGVVTAADLLGVARPSVVEPDPDPS